MRLLILLTIALYPALNGYGQISRQKLVCDAVSHIGIPYASVKVVNKPKGSYANNLGWIALETSDNDSLLVSCVGYQTATVPSKLDTIFLNPIVVDLKEIQIRKAKPKECTIGLADLKKYGTFYLCGNVGTEISTRINIPESFSFYRVRGLKFNSKHESGSRLVRLHIYTLGNDGAPGKELLPKDVFINNNLKPNGQLDLSSFNLILNERALFIGVEEIRDTKPDSKLDECIGIGFTYEEKQDLTFWRSLRDPSFQWRPSFFGIKKNGNPHNLMVSLIID